MIDNPRNEKVMQAFYLGLSDAWKEAAEQCDTKKAMWLIELEYMLKRTVDYDKQKGTARGNY